MPLSPGNRARIEAARSLLRRAPALEAVAALARQTDDDRVAAAWPAARREADTCRRRHLRERFEAEQARDQAETAQRTAAETLTRLEEVRKAVGEVDRWLVQAPTVSARIQEGRASLWKNKLDQHLRDRVDVEDERRGDLLLLKISEAQKAAIRSDLTAGYQGWLEYATREVARDFALAVFEKWTRLDGELIVPAPNSDENALAPVAPWDSPRPSRSQWWKAQAPSALERSQPIPGLWAELGRTLRQQVFLLGALLGIAGLRSNETLAAAALALIPVAWFVVQRDRNKKLEARRQSGEKALQEELLRWAEARMERTQSKIRDHLHHQLKVVVRQRWIAWYRDTVLPQIRAAETQRDGARATLEQASETLRQLDRDHPEREIELLLALE